ncbi:hypothetical protein KC331_g3513 [Hortaea werneckii]|uniref:N-acetyltransferase ESCO zinc-finger domain-containing protein n=1 Tax=Hortaea werneckii TaxID=91943 RepID=A0A3M7DFQ0_HORWE|nr:hypothetical protein KC331_g3513 [Hortaea werneckii]KAI7718882.1 hypothetical protein KC353_g3420 [Hortaea werneckii]RMY63171.1 hypothetical protein D0865_00002 [Hortaea werneckii]
MEPSSSISTTPSSPPHDNAIFSDEPARASSPPSSPPGFPWEKEKETPTKENISSPTRPPPKTAFSLLGKRKALDRVCENARPSKRSAPNSNAKDAEVKPMTQMQISVGQKAQQKCKTCGMSYTASSNEDRKLHDKYHRQNTEGFDVGKEFVARSLPEKVFEGVRTSDAVCEIDCFDNHHRRKKAQTVLEVVQRELGAVEIEEKRLLDRNTANKEPMFRAYMYIKGRKCVGFLLVEQIKEARRVVEPVSVKKTAAKAEVQGKTAAEALKARKRAVEEAERLAASEPIQLSKQAHRASLGVSRIWTSPNFRHQNIASSLLDTAMKHHAQEKRNTVSREGVSGNESKRRSTSAERRGVVEQDVESLEGIRRKDDVAFSQPTESGARLARRWFGRLYGWSVYVD